MYDFAYEARQRQMEAEISGETGTVWRAGCFKVAEVWGLEKLLKEGLLSSFAVTY